MKKVIVGILVMCMLLMTACTQTVQTEGLLLKLEEANTRQALIKNNARIAYTATSNYADGTSYTAYTYYDGEKYVYEEDGYVTVDVAGTVTSYWEPDDVHEVTLYVGEGAYENEQKQFWPLTWYSYNSAETVLSAIKKDGLLYIETEYAEGMEEVVAAYGYQTADVEKVSMTYVAKAKTYELQSLSGTFCMKDGTTVPCLQVEKVQDCPEYVVPEGMFQEDAETVTVTLIENPSAAEEQSHEYVVPAGHYIYLTFSQEYDGIIYADAEYSQQWDADIYPIAADIVGYIKKAS